jgi:hypothetical protein
MPFGLAPWSALHRLKSASQDVRFSHMIVRFKHGQALAEHPLDAIALSNTRKIKRLRRRISI